MAHLTLQLGGPIVVPFSTHFGSRRRRGVPNWKLRSLLEASAINTGLPVQRIPFQRIPFQRIPFQRRHALPALPHPVAPDGNMLDRSEA